MKTDETVATVVQQLISRVIELPDGTSTATARLLHEIGIDFGECTADLMGVHFAFLKAAEAEDIFLDFSSHNNRIAGLPYNFDFVIYHDSRTYWYCAVMVKGASQTYSYISDSGYIEEGSFVEVPFGGANKPRIGVVKECGAYREQNAPYPVRYTKHIIRLTTREEYDSQGSLDQLNWDDYNDGNEIEEANYYIERGDWDEVLEWAEFYQESDKPEIIKKVVECYERCIKQNMPTAALNLGAMYYTGRGVERDYKKAFELYIIAADAGELQAIRNCGYCFYYGRHQEPDYSEAFKYFSLGALLYNDANCLCKLGDLYLNGYGVARNEEYAYIMYNRAHQRAQESEQDQHCLADIQLRVGKCLLRGIGVSKNIEEAHAILSLSLTNFYKRRKTDLFAGSLIKDAKELIAKAQRQLDGEIAGATNLEPEDRESDSVF